MKQTVEEQSRQSEIATEAYGLWEAHGKPSGQNVEFWLEAERRLGQRIKSVPQKKFARVSPSGRSRSCDAEVQKARTVYDGE